MKKLLFGLCALLMLMVVYKKDEVIIIPSEAIRIRIISNSNNIVDIKKKYAVKDKLEEYLYNLLNQTQSISDAREIIVDNMMEIEKIVKENNVDHYNINYGLNHFPKKTYKGVLYLEGEYESLEIKLGKGIGENYWCVLFPPLCLIDENEMTDDVSYKLYIKKVLKIDN